MGDSPECQTTRNRRSDTWQVMALLAKERRDTGWRLALALSHTLRTPVAAAQPQKRLRSPLVREQKSFLFQCESVGQFSKNRMLLRTLELSLDNFINEVLQGGRVQYILDYLSRLVTPDCFLKIAPFASSRPAN